MDWTAADEIIEAVLFIAISHQALPNRPCQTVVVVNGGQAGLSQTLYLQKWPKSVFEIVVRVERKKAIPVESY